MKLNLGVVDIQYADDPDETTVAVARKLEARYGIMRFFWENNADAIGAEFEQALVDIFEGMTANGPETLAVRHEMHGAVTSIKADIGLNNIIHLSETDELFRRFLENREMDYRVRDVPTLAAKEGVSHRFKNPTHKKVGKKWVKRSSRPSFVDTGLYSKAFMTWVDV